MNLIEPLKRFIPFLFLLGVLFLNFIFPVFSVAAGDKFLTEESFITVFAENALGYEFRDQIVRATDRIKARKYREAWNLLNRVEASFRDLMTNPSASYVSVETRSEFEAIRQKVGTGKEMIWLDFGFGLMLHLKAFLQSTAKQYDEALLLLDEQIKYSPTSVQPHNERGYILNSQRRFAEALASYEKALHLSRSVESARPVEAVALRGKGFSLIELGELEQAQSAFEASLRIEPGNGLAKKELQYIKFLKSKRKESGRN